MDSAGFGRLPAITRQRWRFFYVSRAIRFCLLSHTFSLLKLRHDQENCVRNKYKRKKQRKNTPREPKPSVPPRVDQETPAEPQSTTERHNKQENPMSFIKLWREDVRFRVETVALVVGLAVLIVYFLQWRVMERSLSDSQENFTLQNAPVIWVEPKPPTVEVNKVLSWDVLYTNYGHSTAINVRICTGGSYGGEGFKALANVHFPLQCDSSDYPPTSSGVSPPNATADHTTLVGKTPLTADDVDLIKRTEGGALIYGLITYDEIGGHSYETGFCSYRLITGALMHCETNNYVKRTK